MGLSRRQQRLLDQLAGAVHDTDPVLAQKLAKFTRLAGGQPMPRHERLRPGAGRIPAALARPATAAAMAAVRAGITMARATGVTAFLPPARRPLRGQFRPARYSFLLPPDPRYGGGSPLPPDPRYRGGSPLPPHPCHPGCSPLPPVPRPRWRAAP